MNTVTCTQDKLTELHGSKMRNWVPEVCVCVCVYEFGKHGFVCAASLLQQPCAVHVAKHLAHQDMRGHASILRCMKIMVWRRRRRSDVSCVSSCCCLLALKPPLASSSLSQVSLASWLWQETDCSSAFKTAAQLFPQSKARPRTFHPPLLSRTNCLTELLSWSSPDGRAVCSWTLKKPNFWLLWPLASKWSWCFVTQFCY